MAGGEFSLTVNLVGLEEFYVFPVQHVGQSVGGGLQIQQAPLFCFLDPGGIVAVAIEDNALVIDNGLADQVMQSTFKVFGTLQLIGKLPQLLGHSGVQNGVGAGDGFRGAQHPEFKLVAGKSKGAGAIPVCGIPLELGQSVDANAQNFLFLAVVGGVLFDGLQNLAQVAAQEHGHDGGGRFVGTQPVVIARGGYGDPQQILIFVHGLDDRAQEQQELGIFVGSLAGLQKIYAGVRGNGPVVMLAATVDAVKGLLVKQAHQPVALSDLAHHLHGQLVVVRGDVCGGENGSHFVLGRGDLVVLRLGKHAQLPQLVVQLFHKGCNPGLDGAEIVVVQLLTLGRLGAEQGPAGVNQVFALVKGALVNEKILLLWTNGGLDGGRVFIAEELQHPHGLPVDGLHGAQQRGLLVQSLAAVRTEDGGDTQHTVFDKGIGRSIPGGVASGLEGGPQAAGGEGGGIRLALDQLLAGELHNNLAAALGGDETVVLFGGNAGHGLEPVGEVGSALFNGPILHGIGDHRRHAGIQMLALLDGLLECFVGFLRQTCLHGGVVKNHRRKDFRYHIVIPFSVIYQ